MPHRHELVPFQAAHLVGVRWTEEEHAKLLGERAFVHYERYPGYTAFCGGEFLAAAGVVIPYPGMGEAWAIASNLVWSHKVYFHRTVARVLDQIIADFKLRRVQAMVRANFDTSHGWVQRLGFEKEAVLHQYGIKGEDMVVYARFPNA